MGCGCNSNFSGGETFASNRYKPYLTSNRKLNASGVGNNPCPHPCYPCRNGIGCCGVTDYGSCSDYSPRKGRKPRKSLQQQISENKLKYNSFMGFNAKSPIVDTKKYGIPDEYYYEFNTSTGRTPINRNDMNVEF